LRTLLARLATDRSNTWAVELVLGACLVVLLAPAVLWLPLVYQIAVPIAVVVGIAFVSRPKAALFGIFACRVLVDLLWWAEASVGGLNIMQLYSGMVAAVALLLVVQRLDDVQRHPWFPAFVPFVLVIALGAVRSGDLRTAADFTARFLSPCLLMFLVSDLFSTKAERRRMEILIPALAVIPIVLGFWHWANGQANEEVLHGYARLKGGYSNIHNHAHAMAFFSALGLLWLRRMAPRWQSLALVLFIVACFTLMWLTYVRTALTGLVLFAVLFLVLERLWKLAIVGLVAVALATASSAVLQDRFSDVVQLASADESAGEDTGSLGSGRIDIWSTAVHRWTQRPAMDVLFGMGLEQHKQLNDRHLDAHNDYLALLFQMGPIALIAYLAFQAQLALVAWRIRSTTTDEAARTFANFVIALDAMVLITNFLSNSYINRVHVAWLFWGFGGLLFALAADERQKKRPEAT
jgi:O-antigen ligase